MKEPTDPRVIASNINPKPNALAMEEANKGNEMMRLEEEHCVQLARVAAEEPSVRDKVTQLKAMLLEQSRQRAMPPPPSPADFIAQVIENMMAQGFVVPTLAAYRNRHHHNTTRHQVWDQARLLSRG